MLARVAQKLDPWFYYKSGYNETTTSRFFHFLKVVANLLSFYLIYVLMGFILQNFSYILGLKCNSIFIPYFIQIRYPQFSSHCPQNMPAHQNSN